MSEKNMSAESDSAPSAPICLSELETLAKKSLDKMTYEYYYHGAADELSRLDNVEAFNRLKIRPRTLKNVAHIDTSTQVFGKKYPYPIAIAPSAMQRLAHPDGELATSRAAASQGTTMTLSTFSNTSLEDVIKAGREVKRAESIPSPDYWLQLYCFQNRKTSEDLIKRAEAAGYKAVVLTVDTPYLGKRYNELRNKFLLPPHIRLGNFQQEAEVKTFGEKITLEEVAANASEQEVKPVRSKAKIGGPIPGPVKNENDPSISWEETIPWLKSVTSMKIIVKGILTSEDAEIAAKYKVDAVWVSNHGGRQLDTCPSSLDALHEIVRVLRPHHSNIPILFDSGITRGTDVFKALAIGADLCFIGRPTLWGLAYGGQEGIELVLEVLENELRLTMGLAGVKSLKEINRSYLGYVKPEGGIQSLSKL